MEPSPANKAAVQNASYTMTIMPSLKKLFRFIAVAVIAGAIPATILLTQQQTTLEQQAAADRLSCAIEIRQASDTTTSPFTYDDLTINPLVRKVKPGESYLFALRVFDRSSTRAANALTIKSEFAEKDQAPIAILSFDQDECTLDPLKKTMLCTIGNYTAPGESNLTNTSFVGKLTQPTTTTGLTLRYTAMLQPLQENRALTKLARLASCATTLTFDKTPSISKVTPETVEVSKVIMISGWGFSSFGNTVKITKLTAGGSKTGYLRRLSPVNSTTLQFSWPPILTDTCPLGATATDPCRTQGLDVKSKGTYQLSVENENGESNQVLVRL